MDKVEKNLEAKVEAALFVYGDPMPLKKLAVAVGASEAQVSKALVSLKDNLASEARGLDIIRDKDEAQLVTDASLTNVVEKLTKEELDTKLTPAALETLSIIAYLGPCTRNLIDYIRGVNSAFMLRNLMVRGLVERVNDKDRTGGYAYRVTFDFLKHMGVSSPDELPEYQKYVNLANTLNSNGEEN